MAVETGGPGWACLPSQFLAYQLTYFSLGADYVHNITMCPPPLEFSDLLMAKLIALWIPKEQLCYELSKKTPHELSKSFPSFPMYFLCLSNIYFKSSKKQKYRVLQSSKWVPPARQKKCSAVGWVASVRQKCFNPLYGNVQIDTNVHTVWSEGTVICNMSLTYQKSLAYQLKKNINL